MVVIAGLLAACNEDGPVAHGVPWNEADRLFEDPRWVGGDGAYSIDLEDGRVLWLFGDSFVARHTPYDREEVYFINNSLAIQHGPNPATAPMRFYWRTNDEGGAGPMAPGTSETWLWPAHGVRLGDGLMLFYEVLRTPEGEERGMDAFEGTAWTAFFIEDARGSPDTWTFRRIATPRTGAVLVGEAVLVAAPYLYTYGSDDGLHSLYLARWSLEAAERGELTELQWWCGESWCGSEPAKLISIAAPELSIHFDRARGEYLMVQTAGVLATTLAIRSAPSLEGPWSDSHDFFRPPESFETGAFVYAGKAHPMLEGADLVATYVDSDRYLPRFVKFALP